MLDNPRDSSLLTGLGCAEERKGAIELLWLEITGSCNWRCKHCYTESSPDIPVRSGIDDATWLRVIEDAGEIGCDFLQFIGGEPTVHPSFEAFFDAALGAGIAHLGLYTNGSRINAALAQKLSSAGASTSMSWYSTDPATHDAIVGKQGAFGKALRGLRILLDADAPVTCNVTVMEQNGDQVDRTKDFLRELGVAHIGIDGVRAVGRGSEIAQDSSPEATLCGQCASGKLCVHSSGAVTPCIMTRDRVVGDIKTQSLRRIAESVGLARVRRDLEELFVNREQTDICAMGSCNPSCSPTTCNPAYNCAPSKCNPAYTCGPSKCNPAN